MEKLIQNNVTNDLAYIKYLIANARNYANSMQLAVKFSEESELLLDLPRTLKEPTIQNQFSFMVSVVIVQIISLIIEF